jgi:hypothetical protein
MRSQEPKESCCVVDPFCLAPANLEERDKLRLRTVCFSCGQPVCVNCSSRRTYYTYGKVRLCNYCQEDEDGSDRVVMARLRKLAGR